MANKKAIDKSYLKTQFENFWALTKEITNNRIKTGTITHDKVAASFDSNIDYTKLKNLPNNTTVTIDSALSSTSTNPVQNKIVKAAIDAKDIIELENQSDYDALSQTDKKTKSYLIKNASSTTPNASQIAYDSSTTVKGKIDALNTSLSNLEATTISGITWASGISYNYSRIYKMGKLLFVSFYVTYSTAPAYGSIVLTLPNTVKLAQSQYDMCFGIDDSGKRYNVQINSNPSSNTLSFSGNGSYGDACKTILGMAMYTVQ